MSAGHKWRPLERAYLPPPDEKSIQVSIEEVRRRTGVAPSREEALAFMEREVAGCEYWRNDLYQVEVRRYPDLEMAHLNIRRIDGYAGRDWRHFQQIKNELVGPECEGVELYPAESRLTDTSNKFHIYCNTDPAYRFPFGFETRDVREADPGETDGGYRQRPLLQHARRRA